MPTFFKFKLLVFCVIYLFGYVHSQASEGAINDCELEFLMPPRDGSEESKFIRSFFKKDVIIKMKMSERLKMRVNRFLYQKYRSKLTSRELAIRLIDIVEEFEQIKVYMSVRVDGKLRGEATRGLIYLKTLPGKEGDSLAVVKRFRADPRTEQGRQKVLQNKNIAIGVIQARLFEQILKEAS